MLTQVKIHADNGGVCNMHFTMPDTATVYKCTIESPAMVEQNLAGSGSRAVLLVVCVSLVAPLSTSLL